MNLRLSLVRVFSVRVIPLMRVAAVAAVLVGTHALAEDLPNAEIPQVEVESALPPEDDAPQVVPETPARLTAQPELGATTGAAGGSFTPEARMTRTTHKIRYKPLSKVSLSITPTKSVERDGATAEPAAEYPSDHAALYFANATTDIVGEHRPWVSRAYAWDGGWAKHGELYFEDPNLERYGWNYGGALQPFVSGAHFFAQVPFMPYKWALGRDPWCNPIYTLGHYRPGNCVPYQIHYYPWSYRAAAVEGAFLTGVFAIP